MMALAVIAIVALLAGLTVTHQYLSKHVDTRDLW